jgi:hypothetical protein
VRLDPDWQSKYGVPVYVGPDGALYTTGSDGKPQPYSVGGSSGGGGSTGGSNSSQVAAPAPVDPMQAFRDAIYSTGLYSGNGMGQMGF